MPYRRPINVVVGHPILIQQNKNPDPAYVDNPQPPAVLPPVPVSLSKVFRDEPRHISQKELLAMAEAGLIAPWHDRRHEGDAIARRVLEHGARLGAVKLLP